MPRIDLTRADTQPLDFAERLDVVAADCGEDVLSVSGVEISGSVEKAKDGYLLDARVRGSAELRCVRCLAPFRCELDEVLELVLLPQSAAPREDETRLGRDDMDVRFFSDPMLDLHELVTEQVALAVPVKPLCADSCRGLCPRCGASLNEGACSCPEERDERWAPLQGWRPGE